MICAHLILCLLWPGWPWANVPPVNWADWALRSNGEQGGSTYTYNSNGLLAHAVKTVGTKKYAYDLSGNMVYRNGQALGYDLENRLTSVIKNGLAVATFGYSDDDERLWKQGTNTLNVWIDKLFEARGTTNLYHIFAGTRRVATFSPAVKLPGASGNTDYHYYHADHLESSSLITDATGGLAEHYEYTAYGRERANGTAAPDASHRFTGQVFDQDTGLYFYGARYYDPELGRFVQPDTIIPSLWNPQSYNRYSYVLNNPLKYVDPDGHVIVVPILYLIAGGGATYGGIQVYGSSSIAANNLQTAAAMDAMVQRHGYANYNEFNALRSRNTTPTSGTQEQADAAKSIGVAGSLAYLEAASTIVPGGLRPGASTLAKSATRNTARASEVAESGAGQAAIKPLPGGGPAAERGLAGSIRNVNPTGGGMNCVNCAIAGDATLAGNAASALPGGATSIGVLERTFGGTFQAMSGPMEIGSILSQSGNGARGIVFGESLTAGQPGHVFNVINQGGTIRFLDAQAGGLGVNNFNNFQNFRFLPTNP